MLHRNSFISLVLICSTNIACFSHSDILHPSRPNISKDELRNKLATLYKAQKDQVSVFGLRTQFGGGKTTGFGLVYDSPEALKKFDPQYRQVRYGLATKAERASRQQRTSIRTPDHPTPITSRAHMRGPCDGFDMLTWLPANRQAAQEPSKDSAGHGEGQGCQGEEGEIDGSLSSGLGFLLSLRDGSGRFCPRAILYMNASKNLHYHEQQQHLHHHHHLYTLQFAGFPPVLWSLDGMLVPFTKAWWNEFDDFPRTVAKIKELCEW